MSLKFVVLAVCLAAANAGLIGAPLTYGPGAPIAYSGAAYPAIAKIAAPVALAKTVVSEEYDPNPQYSFGYSIDDALTGDSKNQQESRSGDVVQGSYSLTDPDGTRRTVEYTADPINGFNAVVHKEPLTKAIVAAPAQVAYAAPAQVAYHAPAQLAYAAPAIAKVHAPLSYGYSAPLGYQAPIAYAKYH